MFLNMSFVCLKFMFSIKHLFYVILIDGSALIITLRVLAFIIVVLSLIQFIIVILLFFCNIPTNFIHFMLFQCYFYLVFYKYFSFIIVYFYILY